MKHILIFLFLLIGFRAIDGKSQCIHKDIAQRVLDSDAVERWPVIASSPLISGDGRYFIFFIDNKPVGHTTLVARSVDGSWVKEFRDGQNAFFSGDGKTAVFKRNDSLYSLKMGGSRLEFIDKVSSFGLLADNKGEWLFFSPAGKKGELILLNLISGRKLFFSDVKRFFFNRKRGSVVFEFERLGGDSVFHYLRLVYLNSGSAVDVWDDTIDPKGEANILGVNFDSTGQQMVFEIQKRSDGHMMNALWYFEAEMSAAKVIIPEALVGIDGNLSLSSDVPYFSNNGQYILFGLRQEVERKINPDFAKVDIWSYRDIFLQSTALQPPLFFASYDMKTTKITRIEANNCKIERGADGLICNYGAWIIVSSEDSSKHWWENPLKSYYLVSLKDGLKIFVTRGLSTGMSFSPTGSFLAYFDCIKGDYMSMDLRSFKILDLTRGIATNFVDSRYKDQAISLKRKSPNGQGIVGWIEDGGAILVYDNYDIWEVDVSGRERALNLTNGSGRNNHIKFRILPTSQVSSVFKRDSILLTAFNQGNKYNGFYKIYLKGRPKLELLSMGPYTLYHSPDQLPLRAYEFEESFIPVKASNANCWIVRRSSFNEAPNFYVTDDFKSYEPLTSLEPQEQYNWLTVELVNWKQLDGSIVQGILYKPQDFDPRRKYPMIFTYYEKMSYRIYEFPTPGFTNNDINIPWFVSRGYLVFTPDINYTLGDVGGSVCNSIVSAAHYFAKKPWVDPNRMGIQGHSFGGFETLYIITHCRLFAAAAEAAGGADLIRSYGGTIAGGYVMDKQAGYELDQGRMGASLWQRPQEYIDGSPVFKFNSVVTPLLVMHNKADRAVAWEQGLEVFLDMRRLDKKVWMLQYDGGTHSVFGKDAIDYTNRLGQFFDYYLKGAPPPIWMTVGIPTDMKGVTDGYELDNSGRIP